MQVDSVEQIKFMGGGMRLQFNKYNFPSGAKGIVGNKRERINI